MSEDLFSHLKAQAPLADRLRPANFTEVVGHREIVAENGVLDQALRTGHIPNFIFWGPPGVGKTTLARILAQKSGLSFTQVSAIFTGVSELKKIFEQAKSRHNAGQKTILFVDEIHRFNKSQQDAFLPVMENGTIILIGATTENPSFELNAALLSRARVLRLGRLEDTDLIVLLKRAENVLGSTLPLTDLAREELIFLADGDGRALINMIETIAAMDVKTDLDAKTLGSILARAVAQYDKSGDGHYNLISALHKSVRGSDPDAALYWLSRMLEAGEDPNYLARRILRMAVEDIGLAEPSAMTQALSAWETYARLGTPEGELALAQAVIYLALAPKSNATYTAYKNARKIAKEQGSLMPPMHILNAPTRLMKDEGYGTGYLYDHDEADGFSGQNYFPDGMRRPVIYVPKEVGYERELSKRVSYFAKLRAQKKQDEGSK